MNNDIENLIEAYEGEQIIIEREKLELHQTLRRLNQARNDAAKEILKGLIPDLSMRTIRKIQNMVPNFYVDTVPAWFGFGRKVDPEVNIDFLRVRLGHHLDTIGAEAPMGWYRSVVVKFNPNITAVQDSISEMSEMLTTVAQRLEALKRLCSNRALATDKKVAAAVKAQLQHRNLRSSLVRMDSDEDTTSDDVLNAWLWYTVMTPDTTNLGPPVEIEFHAGGGSTGGAGATGSFEDALSDASDAAVTTDDRGLTDHAALGSNSFS